MLLATDLIEAANKLVSFLLWPFGLFFFFFFLLLLFLPLRGMPIRAVVILDFVPHLWS
jgi:hypothetical protein